MCKEVWGNNEGGNGDIYYHYYTQTPIYRSKDGGTTWETIQTVKLNNQTSYNMMRTLVSMALVGDNLLLGGGDYKDNPGYINLTTKKYTYYTSILPRLAETYYGFWFTNLKGVAYVLVAYGQRKAYRQGEIRIQRAWSMYKSLDNGITWSEIFSSASLSGNGESEDLWRPYWMFDTNIILQYPEVTLDDEDNVENESWYVGYVPLEGTYRYAQHSQYLGSNGWIFYYDKSSHTLYNSVDHGYFYNSSYSYGTNLMSTVDGGHTWTSSTQRYTKNDTIAMKSRYCIDGEWWQIVSDYRITSNSVCTLQKNGVNTNVTFPSNVYQHFSQQSPNLISSHGKIVFILSDKTVYYAPKGSLIFTKTTSLQSAVGNSQANYNDRQDLIEVL